MEEQHEENWIVMDKKRAKNPNCLEDFEKNRDYFVRSSKTHEAYEMLCHLSGVIWGELEKLFYSDERDNGETDDSYEYFLFTEFGYTGFVKDLDLEKEFEETNPTGREMIDMMYPAICTLLDFTDQVECMMSECREGWLYETNNHTLGFFNPREHFECNLNDGQKIEWLDEQKGKWRVGTVKEIPPIIPLGGDIYKLYRLFPEPLRDDPAPEAIMMKEGMKIRVRDIWREDIWRPC